MKDEIPSVLCSVTRSYSYKLNCGGYETRDFFCSQTCECRLDDAEETSRKVYQFCKKQVLESVEEYCREHDMMDHFQKKEGRR